MALGINRDMPFNFGYVLIVRSVVVVAIPAFVHASRELEALACSACRKPQPG